MSDFRIRPSEVVLLLSGIILLTALPFLSMGQTGMWTISKVLYGIGVVLFFIDK